MYVEKTESKIEQENTKRISPEGIVRKFALKIINKNKTEVKKDKYEKVIVETTDCGEGYCSVKEKPEYRESRIVRAEIVTSSVNRN